MNSYLIEKKNAENYGQDEKIKLDSQLFTSASCKTVVDFLESGRPTKLAYSKNDKSNNMIPFANPYKNNHNDNN
jgi:hypothetical protein